ncbi:MAG: transketolase [Candidatus Eisenbacteria bacterium]|nr:transketolase [Candidatus Eisenbacteria bacterium]
MSSTRPSVAELNSIALDVRRDILTLLANAQTGHTGGPLSVTDFGTALFFHEMRLDPTQPGWPGRDFWHFSIGHVTPVIYSLMAERGYFELKHLMGFRSMAGMLQGHPCRKEVPGIEVSSGSLGQGLSVAVGWAMAARLDGTDQRAYCVMGDGEQQEGQIWEAAMSAAHYKLDNLCGMVDVNRMQIDGPTEKVMNIEPLADKWRAFGWHVVDRPGHDMQAVLEAFAEARSVKGRPTVILFQTTMGRGVSFMEDDYRWHGMPPKMEQAEKALAELGTSYAEWSARLWNGAAPRVANVGAGSTGKPAAATPAAATAKGGRP